MNPSSKKGIILMNLGSPASPDVPAVRSYLSEFLMDGRVIDIPYLLRMLLVRGIIVPFRAPKSAAAYRSIWTQEGSPLTVLTFQLRDALQAQVESPVVVAMRYGKPSPAEAFEDLMQQCPDMKEALLIPLYPHYAMSSYETAVEYARLVHAKGKYPFSLEVLPPYYRQETYQESLAASIRPWLEQPHDLILFSYHGVPKRHILKGDTTGHHCLQSEACCQTPSAAHAHCYRHQCLETTAMVTRKLGIPAGRFANSFQSRLGREEWLQPYTAERLRQLPGEGVRKLLMVCPAFVSDCLETLEEIAMEGKEIFLHAGGSSFTMIPCLNTHPLWVEALAGWSRGEWKEPITAGG
jgi:protoporphyrin/coproporphyrin ferrochelatase